MGNRPAIQSRMAFWDLVACGPAGDGPFRLVIYYTHGAVVAYFQELDAAFRAIENAEKGPPSDVIPDRQLLQIPDERELAMQCLREETWAVAARH